MKHLFILPALLLLQLICFAQHDRSNIKDSVKIVDAKYLLYDLDSTDRNTGNNKLSFSKIVFNDVRYDTSFIAINWQSAYTSVFTLNRKYNLNGGLAGSLTNYFNHYYINNFSNNDEELICYIKSFTITAKDSLLKYFNPNENFTDRKDNNINLEIECFYKKGDSLFPAIRIDTVYAYHFSAIKKEFPEGIKEIINPLIQKINNADVDKILKRKSYTQDQITARYQSLFNLPILAADTYKKGIYKTFEEFKNNAPSITAFSMKTEKMRVNLSQTPKVDATTFIQPRNTAVFLYDDNNDIIPALTIFGFCDGKTCWIQHGAFYYPLIRVGEAFEFMYDFYYADPNGHTHYTKNLMPLNMENGHID